MSEPGFRLLGHTDHDPATAINERTRFRAVADSRDRVQRNQFVTIKDASTPDLSFLGRLVAGPFFPSPETIFADVEIHGEIAGGFSRGTNNRPTPGSPVYEMSPASVTKMLGFGGDMLLGCLAGREDLPIRINSKSKEVLPRNVGIFGTVGSGKSNSVQVLIEEAAAAGWAVILLDLEGEYIEMDKPMVQDNLMPLLDRFGRKPQGLADFQVYYPISCDSSRKDAHPFAMRLSDFETSIIGELIQTSLAERNALLDCVDHFEQKFQPASVRTETDRQAGLLDATPGGRVPFTLQTLRGRALGPIQ
jgi:Helicase HerA, central domain